MWQFSCGNFFSIPRIMEDRNEIEDKLKEAMHDILIDFATVQFYPPKSIGLKGKLLYLAMLCLTVQPTIAIIQNWSNWNFDTRVSAIENFSYCFAVMCMLIDIYLMPHKTKIFSDIIINSGFTLNKQAFNGFRHDNFDEKCRLVEDMTLKSYRVVKMAGSTFKYFAAGHSIIPICGMITYFFKFESVESLPLLFKFYSPFSRSTTVTNIFEYIFMSILQLLYVYYSSAILATVILQMQIISLCHIRVEMKLFHLNMKLINVCCRDAFSSEYQLQNAVGLEADLRLLMREIAKHHQIIFKKVTKVDKAFKFRLFYYNTCASFQICLSIFICLKGGLFLKMKFFVTLISLILMESFYSEDGQKFQDEGELLREALYDCDWLSKPKWFTSSLQILMTRNNILPKIEVFNIFTLNRNNLTVVTRGVYSYFNLLNRFSK